MELYLDKITEKCLEDILDHYYQKYRKGEIKRRPTRSDIIRTQINILYRSMKEAGKL